MNIHSSNLYFANARSPGFTAIGRVMGALAVAALMVATCAGSPRGVACQWQF